MMCKHPFIGETFGYVVLLRKAEVCGWIVYVKFSRAFLGWHKRTWAWAENEKFRHILLKSYKWLIKFFAEKPEEISRENAENLVSSFSISALKSIFLLYVPLLLSPYANYSIVFLHWKTEFAKMFVIFVYFATICFFELNLNRNDFGNLQKEPSQSTTIRLFSL